MLEVGKVYKVSPKDFSGFFKPGTKVICISILDEDIHMLSSGIFVRKEKYNPAYKSTEYYDYMDYNVLYEYEVEEV